MPTLILRFPGRRYHATPWGHHVNEGLIEWPPSPWRLLRALLSVGYTTLGWPGESPPPEGRSLIEKLAGVLPSYCLTAASGAHTRHYMPLGVLAKGREKSTLVFDTWAQVGDGELAVIWNADLTEPELALLGELIERLGYLGRSESWVVGRLADPCETLPDSFDAYFPDNGRTSPGPGWEQTPLLAPLPRETYDDWRQQAATSALTDLEANSAPGKKPTKKQREQATAPYPPDLIACLQTQTNWLRSHGWSQPPGSRRVLYWRRTDALEAGAPKPRRKMLAAPPVEALLLSMATGSGNDHALPPVTRSLPLAEELHKQLGHALKYLNIGHSRVLSGCDERQQPLSGAHEHAHILPLDLNNDGHLDHFLIWAPMGLDADAQSAIRAVRRTFTKGGIGPLRLALAGMGKLSELCNLPVPYDSVLRGLQGGPAGAREWVSLTPFVAPRHLKPNGANSLEGQVIAELTARDLPEPNDVSVINPRGDNRYSSLALRHRHLVRTRRNGPAPPIDCSFTLLLRFDDAICPKRLMALGYGCHYGLGLFADKSALPDFRS